MLVGIQYTHRKGSGVSSRWIPGPFMDRRRLSAHLDCDTGTRVLPGGTEEGTEEIAEGVPGQEVRHTVGREGRPASDAAPVDLHSDPILKWGHKCMVPALGLL